MFSDFSRPIINVQEFKYRNLLIAVFLLILPMIFEQCNESKSQSLPSNHSFINERFHYDSAQQDSSNDRKKLALLLKEKNYRNNWAHFILTTSKILPPGTKNGGSTMEIIVINKTAFPLDKVHILISYKDKNGDFLKTGEVIISDIPADSHKSVMTPPDKEAKYVDLVIENITAKKLHFCYSAGIWSQNQDDPYFCK